MSNTINSGSSITEVTGLIDLGPTGSLQFQFAKLQLALAMISKEGALDYMGQIENSQNEQKELSAMLQQARQLQADAKAGTGNCSGDAYASYMPAEMQAYMDKNGLAYDKAGNDNRHNKDEWDVAIQSLQAQLDTVGSNTQQLMVFVQDFMGQYNSYLQGSNSVIQQANQTLGELARAR